MKFLKNRLVIGIFCIALSLIIGFVAVPVINSLTSQTVEVVRANTDVGMGVKLTEDMLELVEVGKVNLPENTAYKISDVVGLYATTDMKKSDIVTGVKVTDKLTLPENKIRQMKSNERLVTIQIGKKVLDKFLPNDIVGIYTYDSSGECIIVLELANVSVVSMSTEEGVNILYDAQKAADGSNLKPAKITFILNDIQARKLLTLANSNNFSILLSCRSDNEAEVDRRLNEQATYFEKNNSSTKTNTSSKSTTSSKTTDEILNSRDKADDIIANEDSFN